MNQGYSQTGVIWIWLGPDPEETEERVWSIVEQACCDAIDVKWLETECELETELQNAIEDEKPPNDISGVLVSGYLWTERIDSIDYGVDWDGGFEIHEMIWLYEPRTTYLNTEEERSK